MKHQKLAVLGSVFSLINSVGHRFQLKALTNYVKDIFIPLFSGTSLFLLGALKCFYRNECSFL